MKQNFRKQKQYGFIEESSYSLMDSNDPIEQERLAQLQEHQRRQRKETTTSPDNLKLKPSVRTRHNPLPKKKPKGLSPEENLERTKQWFAQTFPVLFNLKGPTRVLDVHILRDIKQHYKSHQDKAHIKDCYPDNLAIKSILNHYLTSDDYLLQIKEGAKRYNLKGIECGIVTREEENKAIKLSGLKPESRINN